jgi:TPR repeat protein
MRKSKTIIVFILLFLLAVCHKYSSAASTNDWGYLSPLEVESLTGAAKQDDLDAAVKLRLYYISIERDLKKTIEYSRIIARLAGPEGQSILADHLTDSTEEKEQQEGIYWYKMSAEAGYVPSQIRLARLYERGKIVAQDYCEAQYWYEKAARSGDAFSMIAMSEYHQTGKCTYCNNIKAYTWLLAAMEKNKIKPGSSYLDELKERKISFEKHLSGSDIKKARDECNILLEELVTGLWPTPY